MEGIPTQFFQQIGQAVEHGIERHVVVFHQGVWAEAPSLKAMPFRGQRIRGPALERMIEVLETEPDADVYGVAERFGVSPPVLERELAAHRGAWQRYLMAQMGSD